MATPHETSVNAAVKTNRNLARLFAKVGTKDHPRGRILTAYRVARRALRGNVGDRFTVQDVVSELRFTIQAAIQDILASAVDLGTAQAEIELAARQLPPPGGYVATDPALAAVMAALEAQLAAITAASALGEGDEVVLGGGDRVGILNPTQVINPALRWVTAMTVAGWYEGITTATAGEAGATFHKQAIATIDERTTDCCLRVHGQVVPFDSNFKLSGTPRYADELEWSPFHDYCRTSIAMVLPEDAGDDLTQRMQTAARDELQFRDDINEQIDAVKRAIADYGEIPDIRQRATDVPFIANQRLKLRRLKNALTREIHPSHATSGR